VTARKVAGAHPPGKDAASPWRMPLAAWKQVAKRTWTESSDDNVGLIAAGVAFYGFLAIVPLLAATVLVYGLVADHATVARNVQSLAAIMPREVAGLIGDQLSNVVATSDGKKGLGLIVAIAIALFGARGGAGAVITALNIAYEEEEKRGFVRLNLMRLAITAGAVILAVIAMGAIALLGHLDVLLPGAPGIVLLLGKLLSYVLLVLAAAAGAATLYRYGPSRDRARWLWLSPGSGLFALLWLLLTFGFGIYVANFGSYGATYGALGAVVVLLTWLYLSSYILLFGAELNSEFEHQTARDTTKGPEQPLGSRGAWAADHVAGEPQGEGDKTDALADASAAAPAPQAQSESKDLPATIPVRVGGRAAALTGAARPGWLSSLLAGAALAQLRTRGREKRGLAMLAAAAGLALMRRRAGPGKKAPLK
jgi:membrane protein